MVDGGGAMKMAIQITCVAKKGIGFILILRADLTSFGPRDTHIEASLSRMCLVIDGKFSAQESMGPGYDTKP
jgi:hypothetical protein